MMMMMMIYRVLDATTTVSYFYARSISKNILDQKDPPPITLYGKNFSTITN